MIWNICFILSVLLLIAGVVTAIVRKYSKKVRDPHIFIVLAVTVFTSAMCMFFAYEYTNQFVNEPNSVLNAVLVAAHDTIGLFVVNTEFAFFKADMGGMLPGLVPVCSTLMAIYFISAPMFTFGFVLSFFKNLRARWLLAVQKRRDVYVFSELNEKSVVLAEDIKRKDAHRVVVFCDVIENDEEKAGELVTQARRLGALLFVRDILDINFKKHARHGLLYFFITGEDDAESVNQAVGLIREYGELESANLYLFSDSASGELLLCDSAKHKMKIRRINESRALIQRTLYDDPITLFESAHATDKSGDKIISAVIVGLGGYGTEMLKTLLWYGQMDGYRLEIHAFDRSPDAGSRLAYACPEVLSPQYNGKYVEGEAYYSVKVHSGVDVGTKEFAKAIGEIRNASFVLISLGNDDLNVETATGMRVMFERMKIKPAIYAVVHNSELAACLKGLTNYRNQPYKIQPIGALVESYSEEVILRDALEQDALSIHAAYGGKPEDFFAYEYNYRSSAASALHNKARARLGIHRADLPESERTPEQNEALMSLEHRRWNAYMRSIGYVYSGSKDSSSRNDLGKMHHNLVCFEELNDEDRQKDRDVGSIAIK
ncbi:MAG: hypothetical protein IKW24_00615 [Clostridia bacterium]|nr:hypothetical protein [Clostridia bacterium]